MTEHDMGRLASIESLLLEQQKHQKKVLLHTRLRTLCTALCVALLCVTLLKVIAVVNTVNRVDLVGMTDSIDTLIDSSNRVLAATEDVVRTANTDLTNVLRSFNAIDIDGLNAGIAGIASVDFARLNESIADFSAVVAPLSAFFGGR